MPVLYWLRTEGLCALAISLLLYVRTGAGWWLFAALLLTPDIAMLPYLWNAKAGSVTYNLAHNYAFPLLLAGLASVMQSQWLMPYVLIWTAHIGMDRALGYGLKYPTGFGATHLLNRVNKA